MDQIPLAHEQLDAAIAARGATRARAASLLGVSLSYLARVLRAEHLPSSGFRLRAERSFGVPRDQWDPRERERAALVRLGYRPARLARHLRIDAAKVLVWWRGGVEPTVARKVAPLIAGAAS